MTRKQRRAVLIGTSLGVLALAVGLVLMALRDSIVFFYTPAEVAEKHLDVGQRFRLGGLVENGSLKHGQGATISFAGVLPDLFREGQGVVAEGMLNAEGVFHADSVLAKHDEKYMPPEIAKKLKEQGVWRGDAQAGALQGASKVD